MKLLIQWAISTGALMLLPVVFGDNVEVDSWKTAVIAAVAVGIVNTVLRPILRFVALPARILTLGLFNLVINGACLFLVTRVVDGFVISGSWMAVLAALVYTVVTSVAGAILIPEGEDKPKRRDKKD